MMVPCISWGYPCLYICKTYITKIGIRGKLLDSIKALYTNPYSSVKLNNKLSPAFEISQVCQFVLTCGETFVLYTDSYKSLGVVFTEHLSWSKSVENTTISANKAASYLIAKTKSSGAFVYNIYNHLYKALVLSIIKYSSFIWGLRCFDQQSNIQNNLMRSILGVSRNAPNAALATRRYGMGTNHNCHKNIMH